MYICEPKLQEFLKHSNWIEREYSQTAMVDARKAWDYQISVPITVNSILETHKILIDRLEPAIAGNFRNGDVWIGNERKKFIHEVKFREEIERLIEKMNRPPETGLDLFSRRCHVKFEKIHPFFDGNGRVGRILYNVHRLRIGLDIHVIHEGEEQFEYYKWFR